tara:strand:+ start:242 stop:688 length:447 start_codon:yes stop_codon:yes gene_type:complete
MNIDKLREELTIDEGCKYEIYNDHLGYKTYGIGHLCKKSEPEYNMDIGTPVSKRRVNTVFAEDVMTTIDDCRRMYKDFDQMPEEVQLILCNMMFNMGYTRLGKFRKLKTNIEKQNWVGASKEMKSSKWYTQVTNRAERLVQRMASVGE